LTGFISSCFEKNLIRAIWNFGVENSAIFFSARQMQGQFLLIICKTDSSIVLSGNAGQLPER